MTSRERLLVWAGGAAALLLVAFVGYAFAWTPLQDAQERTQQADEKRKKTEQEVADAVRANGRILKKDPRLSLWKELSLPPADPAAQKQGRSPAEQKERHLSVVQTDYKLYLNDLLSRSGFAGKTIRVAVKAPDKRGSPTASASRTKEVPLFERLAFAVSAQGPQDAVYKALRDFHKTTVLHQVRDFSVSVAKPRESRKKADPDLLDFSMTVEALIMRGGESRSTVMTPKALPKQPLVLAAPGRDYLLLKKRSLFTGLMDPPPPPRDKKKEEKKKDPPKPTGPSDRERLEVLEYVKLTMLSWNPDRKRWEATLYDQAQGKADEIKIDSKFRRRFQIENEREKVILDADLISISLDEGMIFQADNKKVYRARCGDFLDAVWKKPLTDSELRKLGLKKG